MVNKKECEHELYLHEEKQLPEGIVFVKIKCSLCGIKFKGDLEEDESLN